MHQIQIQYLHSLPKFNMQRFIEQNKPFDRGMDKHFYRDARAN